MITSWAGAEQYQGIWNIVEHAFSMLSLCLLSNAQGLHSGKSKYQLHWGHNSCPFLINITFPTSVSLVGSQANCLAHSLGYEA